MQNVITLQNLRKSIMIRFGIATTKAESQIIQTMKNNQVSLGKGESFGFPFFYLCFPSVGSRVASLKTKDSQARFRFVKFFKVAIIKLDSVYQKIQFANQDFLLTFRSLRLSYN